jgi:flagellar hook protein FlgE
MASLFGALDTAVSGLTAQSAAFTNISNNIANSQTAGFKETNTNFADFLSTTNATTDDSGTVIATPEFENELQGTISASTDPLSLAISGQGFFQVSQENGTGTTATVDSTPEYSRNGDFTLNSAGFIVNSSNQLLNGWVADPTTGVINEAAQVPIQINQSPIAPTATANVTLAANLPATPATSPITSQIDVFDSEGTPHTVDLTYTQTAADTWTVSLNAPDATTPALGSAQIDFGSTVSGNPVGSGTLGSLTNATGVTASSFAAGSPATITFSADFGNGPQSVNLQLGNYGSNTGLTQFAGTTFQSSAPIEDGSAPGNFSGVATQSNGDVVVSYSNGQSKVVAKVPVVQFANADALQSQNGQGFTATISSGGAQVQDIANSGSTLVAGSVEGSNVDIATQFTQLIVAQQAYAANAKVVTTADDLMTTTIDMKR